MDDQKSPWLPIMLAPRDGTWILGWSKWGRAMVSWQTYGMYGANWYVMYTDSDYDEVFSPTHFAYLPPEPDDNTKKDKTMITILNTNILTAPGSYALSPLSLEQARFVVRANEVESAVGHQSTADVLTRLLDVPVSMNRTEYKQQPNGVALTFKLRGRPPEGVILTAEQIEEIGYDFMLLRRAPEFNSSVVLHGSAVANPEKASDIDIIISEDSKEVRTFLGWEAFVRGGKPLDVHVAPYVPALPLETAPPMSVLAGPPLPVKTAWDLSAWVRACALPHSPARWLYSQVVADESIDSRLIGMRRPGVVLVLAESPQLGAYHGGGRVALASARAKAPDGWGFCMGLLPESARKVIEAWVDSGVLSPEIRGYSKSAPAASSSELTLTQRGLYGAYASDVLPW